MKNLREQVEDFEGYLVAAAMKEARGSVTVAAEVAGLSFRQMRYLADKHGLAPRVKKIVTTPLT